MNSSISGIIEDLELQSDQTSEHLKCNHLRYLKHLSPTEKDYLAEKCMQWAWNVGSLKVMSFLQSANVLSMTEYLLEMHINNSEEAQLIFSDLLEAEYNLLANLIKHLNSNNSTALAITEIVTEGLRRLSADLSDDPNLLQSNYLTQLKRFIPDTHLNTLKTIHFKLFLEATEKCDIIEAFQKQKVWTEKFINSETSNLGSFVTDVIGEFDRNTKLKQILEKSAANDFKCWKFCLLLLKFTIRFDEVTDLKEVIELKATTKKFVKDTLKRFVEAKDANLFLYMMLIARQICYCNEQIHGSYATWFKATFGELKYFIEGEEFTYVIQTMINMIEYENDKDILQVHINTNIPAPIYCNHIVVTYKQMLRSKLFYCTTKLINAKNTDELAVMDKKEKPTDNEPDDTVYVLDDDDDDDDD